MKKRIYILFTFFFPILVAAQSWKINPAGTTIGFVIKNAGISVDGNFKGLSGEINFDNKELSKSFFNVSIDASSVNTDNTKRDAHLKKKEYFDVVTYSKITFKTKSITPGSEGKYIAAGDLTIKGKTKEIKFPFTFTPNASGGTFQGSFTLNRLDFGVGESSWILSDDAMISLVVAVIKP